jgi:predicted nucleotidyltransferase
MTVTIPHDTIADFCRRHQVRRLALFGSALRDDFSPDSDIDVLVEFAEDTRIGLFAMGAMQMELSALLGREVDLKTAGFLHPRFRQQVIEKAETIYEA